MAKPYQRMLYYLEFFEMTTTIGELKAKIQAIEGEIVQLKSGCKKITYIET